MPFRNRCIRLGVLSVNKNVLHRLSQVSVAPIVSLNAKFKHLREKNGFYF